jgi:asparagine synthase (glutamine-hydrolysing)
MRRDLDVLGGDGRGSWSDPAGPISMARAYRRELGCEHEAAVVEHGRCVVVLDGRLSASTRSDSVELIERYLRWGDDCVAHVDGDYAFALWDRDRRRLLCGCDVLGRRTLGFHWDGSALLACTRVVTLLAHPRVPRRIDATYAAHALCELWAQPPGSTPFAGIRRLRPGFSLIVDGSIPSSPTLTERRVATLSLGPPRVWGRSGAVVEEFWALLDASVARSLRGARQPCVLLSGGLDSGCVADAASRPRPELTAYSLVGQGTGAVDERRAIEAVLAANRRLRWRSVATTADGPLVEVSDETPVCDDPVIAGAALLPSSMRAWRSIVADGFDVALDGEGGDEIFDLPMRLGDLFRGRAWVAGVYYLARQPALRATIVRRIVVPNLRGRLLRAWTLRERRQRDPMPPWMSAAFRRTPAAEDALEQHTQWLSRWSFDQTFPALLENAPAVGSAQAIRLLQAAFGLTTRSPFMDRSIAEFASRLPVGLRVDPAHGKAFLRRAVAEHLPEQVRWRPKREPLYEEARRSSLGSERARALMASGRRIEALAEWVDFTHAERILAHAARADDVAAGLLEQLYALCALVGWWQRVAAAYGSLDGPS